MFFKEALLFYLIKVWYFSFTSASIKLHDSFGSYDFSKYLINTPGCRVPNYNIDKTKREDKSVTHDFCGERNILLKKTTNQTVQFYFKQNSHQNCLYRFMFASSHELRPDMDVIVTSWIPFRNRTTVKLKSDFIEVQCISLHDGEVGYDDVYGTIKKVSTNKKPNDALHWNVLVIGMDTMSRTRALSELPRTVKYLQSEGWMDFKAYNKIAENTIPNVLSILTNKNISTLNRKCQLDMYPCNDVFIWSRFKTAGYATAYGDDQSMASFSKQPTDHYLKTLFLTKEVKPSAKNCFKRMLSASYVFDYAHEFMNTYKRDKFFGYFWVTTLSHETNKEQSPSMFDDMLRSFFQRLSALDVRDNTFVVFHSDHGLRFSHYRKALESYYESRLPMFFMKVPSTFRKKYPRKYVNLHLQQNRLIVPFDLHLTLHDISTNFSKLFSLKHESCKQCTSLFTDIKLSRTCADAGVEDIWCACRELKQVSVHNDTSAFHSLGLIMLRLYNITESIRTKPFTRCHELSLLKLLRVHTFEERSKTFYVIAGILRPDATGFEATVSKVNMKYDIVSLEITTSYERTFQCVLEHSERVWCVCKIMQQ